jgi:hypothetical protein
VVGEEINAAKETISGEEVWDVIRKGSSIVVASGSKILTFDPTVDNKQEIIEKISGRSGNLRAPTLRIGSIFFVGYNEKLYEQITAL